MAVQNPGDLFQYQLSSAYFTRQRAMHFLPMVEQHSDNPQIKQLVGNHLDMIQQQVPQLEECFRMMGMEPMDLPPQAMQGLQGEFELFLEQDPSPEMLNLFCLGSIAQMTHHGIAIYRLLLEEARAMGESPCLSILAEILSEEESVASQAEQLALRLGVNLIQRVPPQ